MQPAMWWNSPMASSATCCPARPDAGRSPPIASATSATDCACKRRSTMLPPSKSRSSAQRRRQLTLGVWLAIASAPGWCAVADSTATDAGSEHGGAGVSLAALDLSAFGATAHDFEMAEAADPDGGTPLYLDVY